MCDMESKKIELYDPPVNYEGNPYWIPIVMKNKDQLVGFLNSIYIVTEQVGLDADGFFSVLSSERFNDVLRDGRRGSDLTDVSFKAYVKALMTKDMKKMDMRDEHEGCSPLILIDYYLSVSCTCGNFYGFKEIADIPSHSMQCDMCSRTVIDYTGKDDDELAYDGEEHLEREVEEIIEEVRQELSPDEDGEDENDLGF
tara:strand:- start:2186 stop:2779 length:594 start_codon:yes stop_codon:yes gene_type:complete